MAAFGQLREDELRPDQLEIGHVYRLERYSGNTLLYACLARFKRIYGTAGQFMEFTIVRYGTHPRHPYPEYLPNGEHNIDMNIDTNPTHETYYRFFRTAAESIVPRAEQRAKQQALHQVFASRFAPAEARGLSNEWFAPNPRRGGRKYKTRQTKIRRIRRKNRTRKNRRRTNRR